MAEKKIPKTSDRKPKHPPTKYTIAEREFGMLQQAELQLISLKFLLEKTEDDDCLSAASLIEPIGEDISHIVNHCREVENEEGGVA